MFCQIMQNCIKPANKLNQLKLIRVKYITCLVSCLDISDIAQGIKETVDKQCLRGAPLIHFLVTEGHVIGPNTAGLLPGQQGLIK